MNDQQDPFNGSCRLLLLQLSTFYATENFKNGCDLYNR